jgi:hypothetical protein
MFLIFLIFLLPYSTLESIKSCALASLCQSTKKVKTIVV